MKIVHIAPPWITIPPKNYGGTEIVIANLIEEEVAQGHDVTLIAPADAQTSARLVSFYSRSLIDSGVPWQAHLKVFYHYYRALEYIKNHSFDIVHTHLSSGADMYIYPLVSLLKITTPLIATLHSRFPFDRVQSWTGDADPYYLEWLSSIPVVAISESARSEVPYPLNFVGVIHHGLPLKSIRSSTKPPETYLVWLGRIVPDKGPHHAISVAKAAGLPLILAGTVDRHLSECVQYFEEEIKPHIDNEQIKYIGPVNLAQKMKLLSRARAFLNPIEWEEPFGMVIIEAMAVGCPVISFARGAASEIIVHGKTGFLVHDSEDMLQAVSRIDSLDRSAIRRHVEQHFSIQTMTEKYLKTYKRVISTSLLETSLSSLGVRTNVDTSSAPQTLLTSGSKPQLKTDSSVSGHYAFPSTTTAEAEPPG